VTSDLPRPSVTANLTCSETGKSAIKIVGSITGDL
jgi:hypothetical protein